MKQKLLLLITLVLFGVGTALGQTITAKGKVVDENRQPVPSATVRLKGDATKGTFTNMEGNFTLQAKQGEIIIVSFVGYKEIEVAAKADLGTLQLALDSETLGEVVVTALGIERQKKDLGYSTAKIDSKELTQAKTVNIATGLQGKVPGLNITSLNSGVFDDVKINLRGIRSLMGDNSPMLVVDGVPLALSYLSSLNPNDLMNVNILKGSSAAAIYGPDARNGVILITTKSSAYVTKPQITFSTTAQWSSISFFPEFQTTFGSGSRGEFVPYENESWGPAYDGSMRQQGRKLEDGSINERPYSPIRNNRSDFFNTGVTIQNDLSYVAKGFYFSAQDAMIKGIVPGDSNRRTGVRMSAEHEYKNFKVAFSTNYIQSNWDIYSSDAMYNYYSDNNVGMHGGLMDLVFATQAWVPLTEYKLNNKWGEYNNYYNEYSLNPYQAVETWRSAGRQHDLISNLHISYKIIDGLTLNYRAANSFRASNIRDISKSVTPSEWAVYVRNFRSVPQSVYESQRQISRISSEPFITFDKTFDEKYKLGVILGSYLREEETRNINVGAANLVIDDLYNLSARTGEPRAGHSRYKSRLFSIYGNLSFGYKDWAFLEFSGRWDKTSVLDPNNNSFFYPGVNASIVLTEALPSIKSDYLSFLKIRASWNKTGNADVNPYILAPTYTQSNGFPYDNIVGYRVNNSLTDPLLKPEFINSTEIGFESSLFKQMLTLDFTYYNQLNTDQVIPIRVPRPTGFTFRRINAASFRNYGMELSAKLNNFFTAGDFSSSIGLNYSYNNSNVISIYGDQETMDVGGYFVASTMAKIGSPAFIISAKDYKRDDQGRVIVDPKTGLPSPNDSNIPLLNTRTMPLHIVGGSLHLSWKGLTLSTVFEYKGGHHFYNYQGTTMAWDGQSMITAANNRERFVFPNSVVPKMDENWLPVLDSEGNPVYEPNTNVTVTLPYDYFHEDIYRNIGTNMIFSAASLRWRELSLSYSLPQSLLSKQNILTGVDLSVVAKNLMLWVPKTNQWADPDFSVYDDNTGGSVNSSINPPTRTIGASISLKF